MNLITLLEPEINARAVTFRWRIEPPSALYRVPQFTLNFPATVDLARVPRDLWWTIALVCLHSQWVLLRPCRIVLPVRLRAGEAETWLRLTDAQLATLETYRGTTDFARRIEIIEDGPPLAYPALTDTGRCATAFSGGKDSLTQVGLLAELTARPVLVTTTSPMPGLEDHTSRRRRHVLSEITRRRDVTLVEVESDYRANFDHGFAQNQGYWISVNELTDTFLYTGALIAAGAALGATHLFLASEAEVQENVERDGRIVQHTHMMYSAITQGVLNRILARWGLSYGSLTTPLHSAQVQQLLWTRYADLRDLQYSCWRVKNDEAVCNNCSQCLRIALAALALGDNPARIGVQLGRLLRAMKDWTPTKLNGAPELPLNMVSAHLHAQVMRSAQAISPAAMIKALAQDRPQQLLAREGWEAWAVYRNLRRHAASYDPGPAPGYCHSFLSLLDPLLSDGAARIFAAHFAPQNGAAYNEVLTRSIALTQWITAPLGVGEAQ